MGAGLPPVPPVNNTQPNRLAVPLPPVHGRFARRATSGTQATVGGAYQHGNLPPAGWQFPYKPNPFTAAICTSDPCSPTLDPNSAAIITGLEKNPIGVFSLGVISACQPGTNCAGIDGTYPTYFAAPTDPQYQITCTGAVGPRCAAPANLPIPNGAVASASHDHHAIVIVMTSSTAGTEYNFEQFTTTPVQGGGKLSVGSIATCTVTSFAANGTCKGGGNAAGLPEVNQLLDPREILSGSINHVLSGPMNCPDPSYVWPANDSDGRCAGSIKQGQRVWLDLTDAQIEALPAPHAAWDKTILHALHHYGIRADDSMGASPNNPWSFSGYDDMTQTLWGGQASWPAFFTEVQNECPTCNLGYSNGASHLQIPTAGILPSNLHVILH